MSKRYICLHGHFYQPPRENPWLEAIELQESAAPFHDWNERITDECYASNGASRILDDAGNIVDIVNNYSRLSYNFGPTLLSWLEQHRYDVYEHIIEADRASQERFSGHGSAMSQAYNHIIMPLANVRDRRTQVVWGIRDFEKRFGRRPEGMWLPETAVDVDSLEALAQHGIKFTVLAPHQAERVRPMPAQASPAGNEDGRATGEGADESGWIDVSDGSVDPGRAYLHRLPSGRSIVVFFYDGPISRAVAFEELLHRGEQLSGRLLDAVDMNREEPQLVHIATDGETYGHHHRHGDMALAFALRQLEENEDVELTNYGEFLERHPPTWEAVIAEATSWSCVHGVERWRSDCGCHTGGQPGWNQRWREPLRRALDWLRDSIARPFEREARKYFDQPWKARDGYIDVILDRSPDTIDAFCETHAGRKLEGDQLREALQLMELQRHAMLMYTSCGWFFNELSGIETVQVIQYAGRVVQLAEILFDTPIRQGFLERLEKAESNLERFDNGRQIFEKSVVPATLNLRKVASHYAISSLFEGGESTPSRIYCYLVADESRQILESGEVRLATGRATVSSVITHASDDYLYAALHLGGHNVTGGVRRFQNGADLDRLRRESREAFQRAETPALIRLIDRFFGGETFSLRSLFRDEQDKVMSRILESAVHDAEETYRRLYQPKAPLLRFLADLDLPQPRSLEVAAQIVINNELRRLFEEAAPNPDRLDALLSEAKSGQIDLEREDLKFTAHHKLVELSAAWEDAPYDIELVERLHAFAQMARRLPFDVPLWEAQNVYWDILNNEYRQRLEQSSDNVESRQWVDDVEALSDILQVALPERAQATAPAEEPDDLLGPM